MTKQTTRVESQKHKLNQRLTSTLLGFSLLLFIDLAAASLDAAYTALAKGNLAEAARLFQLEAENTELACADTTEKNHQACLNLSLASAGLGEIWLQRDNVTKAYQHLASAQHALNSAAEYYSETHSATPNVDVAPAIHPWLVPAYEAMQSHIQAFESICQQQLRFSEPNIDEASIEEKCKKAKRLLEEEYNNSALFDLDVNQIQRQLAEQLTNELDEAQREVDELFSEANMEQLIEQRSSEMNLTPAAKAILKNQLLAEVKKKKPKNPLAQVLTRDPNYAREYAEIMRKASSIICENKNNFQVPVNGSDIAQLFANQQIYIKETHRRLSITRQIDEANDIVVTDILQPRALTAIKDAVAAHQRSPAQLSSHAAEFSESIARCLSNTNTLLNLGLDKAITYQYQNFETLTLLQEIAASDLIDINTRKLNELTFMVGIMLHQQGRHRQAKPLIDQGLDGLSATSLPLDSADESFVSHIKPLLEYSRVFCHPKKGCPKSVSAKVHERLEAILQTQATHLNGKRAFIEIAREQITAGGDFSYIKRMPGTFALGMGVQFELAQVYFYRSAELAAAEVYLAINDIAKAKDLVYFGDHSSYPADIFFDTILAYEYAVRAKLAEREGDSNQASDHWQNAVYHYDQTLPLAEVFIAAPKFFATDTKVYEDAARFFIDTNNHHQAIKYLEKARQHSVSGKQLPSHVDLNFMVKLRESLLADHQKLLTKGAGGDQQLIEQFTFKPGVTPAVPGPSDIFYLLDSLSFLPELTDIEAYQFTNKLNQFEWYSAYQGLQYALVPNSRVFGRRAPSNNIDTMLTQLQKAIMPQHTALGFWQTRDYLFSYELSNRRLSARYHAINENIKPLEQLVMSSIRDSAANNKSHIVVLANGTISQLPLAKLLHSENQERSQSVSSQPTSISHAPSLTSLAAAHHSNSNTNAALFSPNTRRAAPINYEQELSSLKELVPTQAYLGTAATIEQLKRATKQYGILHLASHARLNTLNPEFSYIALNDGNGGLDRLYNHELSEIPFTNVDLVVLNACETSALSQHLLSNEFSSLQETILTAGANAVVASIRPVADDIAADFGQYLYQSLGANYSLATAFKMAQEKVRTAYPESDQWAYFTLNSRYGSLF